MKLDNYFMQEAIKEAEKAFSNDEIPVGCVIVYNDKVISRGHNLTEKSNQVIDHAEIIAIKKANTKLKNWRLNDCVLYTTLEPCSMCKEVIKRSKINKVIYLLKSNKDANLNYQEIIHDNTIQKKHVNSLMDEMFEKIRVK